MIELIFVIVIIGILAAVAIPKLAANRTDAQAQVCVHEAGQFLTEVSGTYTTEGFEKFKTIKTSDMTNIYIAAKAAGKNGLPDAVVHGTTGVSYYCDGVDILKFSGVAAGADYNLTLTAPTLATGISPAAFQAGKSIKDNMLNGATTKVYSL